MSGQSSYGSGIPPNGLADRIALYLDDAPHGGGHSDAAGSNSWELLQEAMDVLRAPAQQDSDGDMVARANAGKQMIAAGPALTGTSGDTTQGDRPAAMVKVRPSEAERQRQMVLSILKLDPVDQFRIASLVAENVGYVLIREPNHPDSPHSQEAESVSHYVENYRFEFEDGRSYTPNDQDKALLEDAIEGFRARLEVTPQPTADAQGVSDSGKLSDPCEIKRRITRAMDSTSDPVTKSDLRDIVAVLAPSSNPRLVKALHDLRVWLETEGCSDQVETIDDALVDCGIFEVRCANCDGVGEWDEGPLAATSRHQISPDYRHMVCSDCSATGIISIAPAKTSPALTSTEGK